MTSNINVSSTFIDSTFPIAGTVNDSRIFHTNWAHIAQNFSTAASEITQLQGLVGVSLPIASNVVLGAVRILGSSGLIINTNGNLSVSPNYALLSGAAFTGNISSLNFSGNSSGINTGDQTITLTNDVTGSGTGSFAATLATVNANVGTFGNATYVPTITVNAKGLVTAASQTAMSNPASSISVTGTDITLSGMTGTAITNATLANTAVTPGFYTSANIVIDSKGRITSAANGSSSGGSITALNGDVNASGVGNVVATLSNTTVTAGSYSYANITVDSKGRITSAATGSLAGFSYNAANVQITGGNIDGTWIGNTTPVGGKFTTGTFTSNVTAPNFVGNVVQTMMPSNNQTGITYTLVLTDAGKFLTFGNAAATTVTIPSNANVAFYIDTSLSVCQTGAGKVTFAGQAGVTINSQAGNKSLAAQYAGAVLQKTGTDTWLLIGNLIA